jgi:hypothetical protein
MFSNEPLRNRIALFGILALACVLSFGEGVRYQKEHGPPGSECTPGKYREMKNGDTPAECVNGFWENLPPGFPWPEEKKP